MAIWVFLLYAVHGEWSSSGQKKNEQSMTNSFFSNEFNGKMPKKLNLAEKLRERIILEIIMCI